LDKLFHSLLAIKSPAELKLTLLILARAAQTADPCPPVTYAEFRSATGLAPATIAQGLKDMLARGYICRYPTKKKQPARYQVFWDKLGLSAQAHPTPATATASPLKAPLVPGTPEFFFTDTGFLDLLPQAKQIAREFGYGDDEIIQAVCWVFDKQRTNPPHINRTAWFTTVFREKIQEAHAYILANQRRKTRELQTLTPGTP